MIYNTQPTEDDVLFAKMDNELATAYELLEAAEERAKQWLLAGYLLGIAVGWVAACVVLVVE